MISFDYLVDTEELDGVRGRLFVDGYGTEHIPPCYVTEFKSSSLGGFSGPGEVFVFWPDWRYFPVFYARNMKRRSDFHC